jgi:hypothetical protein
MKISQFNTFTFVFYLGLVLVLACTKNSDKEQKDPNQTALNTVSRVGEPHKISESASYDELLSSDVVSVQAGNSTYFIGYQQVSPTNQDPVLAKYVDGELEYFRSDYETTGDDCQGYGLIWDGSSTLYAVFSVTGSQGEPVQDFRRFAINGWHEIYGQDGGAKALVVAKINTDTGQPEKATYAMARLSNGDANTLVVKDMQLLNSGHLKLETKAWYSPLKTNKQPFTCQGEAPFDYEITLSADLSYAVSAEAPGCTEDLE